MKVEKYSFAFRESSDKMINPHSLPTEGIEVFEGMREANEIRPQLEGEIKMPGQSRA